MFLDLHDEVREYSVDSISLESPSFSSSSSSSRTRQILGCVVRGTQSLNLATMIFWVIVVVVIVIAVVSRDGDEVRTAEETGCTSRDRESFSQRRKN